MCSGGRLALQSILSECRQLAALEYMNCTCVPHERSEDILTSSSLAVSTLYIVSPLMTPGGNTGGFCEEVISISNVFLVLRPILILADHWRQWSASSWSEVSVVGIYPSVFDLGYFPSSVTESSSTYLIIGWLVWKSFIRNRSAASLVPWGTPPFIYTQDDMMLPILTLCFLLVRKDATQLTKQPCTPRLRSLHNTIVWPTWPNAGAYDCIMYRMLRTIQDQIDFQKDLDKLNEWTNRLRNKIQLLKMPGEENQLFKTTTTKILYIIQLVFPASWQNKFYWIND